MGSIAVTPTHILYFMRNGMPIEVSSLSLPCHCFCCCVCMWLSSVPHVHLTTSASSAKAHNATVTQASPLGGGMKPLWLANEVQKLHAVGGYSPLTRTGRLAWVPIVMENARKAPFFIGGAHTSAPPTICQGCLCHAFACAAMLLASAVCRAHSPSLLADGVHASCYADINYPNYPGCRGV